MLSEINIKKRIGKILELVSLSIKINHINIRVANSPNQSYHYCFVHVYFEREKNLGKLKKLERVLDGIFKKESVDFLLYTVEGKCTV